MYFIVSKSGLMVLCIRIIIVACDPWKKNRLLFRCTKYIEHKTGKKHVLVLLSHSEGNGVLIK